MAKGNSLRLTVEVIEKHGRRKTDPRIADIEYEALLQAHRILFPGSAALSRRPVPLQKRLWLRGKEYDCTTAQAAMVIVLRELAYLDTSFLQRCAADQDARGRKRRYIAQTPAALYPDRDDGLHSGIFNTATRSCHMVGSWLPTLTMKLSVRLFTSRPEWPSWIWTGNSCCRPSWRCWEFKRGQFRNSNPPLGPPTGQSGPDLKSCKSIGCSAYILPRGPELDGRR